jgi:large subunit ribosomal protein L23
MNQERLMSILLEPRVSEKSTMVADKNNQFVFKVAGGANKQEIKRQLKRCLLLKLLQCRYATSKVKANYSNTSKAAGRTGKKPM